jgi:hypothetical protein
LTQAQAGWKATKQQIITYSSKKHLIRPIKIKGAKKSGSFNQVKRKSRIIMISIKQKTARRCLNNELDASSPRIDVFT